MLAGALGLGACGGGSTPPAMAGSTSEGEPGSESGWTTGPGEGAAADADVTTTGLTGEETTVGSTSGGGSTGSAEDEGFGMDDDMPLVAKIPPIKEGLIPVGELVELRDVRATTPIGGASHGSLVELYVQDPEGGARSGILVRMPGELPGFVLPGDEVSVVGVVRRADGVRYLLSKPDDIHVPGFAGELGPIVLDTADLTPWSPVINDHEGVLVRLEDVDVTALLPGGQPVLDGVLHVDTRFASDLPPLPGVGGTLQSIVGPLVVTPEGLAIAPRHGDDVQP